uniref:Uncharacterized protein n=1 Tax=Dicentrarchus labrax TaxID=13489 RepID=A0A8C4GKM5_DICLA
HHVCFLHPAMHLCFLLHSLKCYGNVYSLFIGPRAAVVINGAQAMKEAMITKAADFAGRPQDIFNFNCHLWLLLSKRMVLADYGASWKEHRRFALMTLRNFGLGKQSMEQRILGEIGCSHFMFHNAASNIICQVLFGTRYDYDDNFIKVVVQCFKENSKIANGAWAMVSHNMFAFKNIETCKKLATCLITEHKETRVPGQPRDFLDCYLDELDKVDDCSSFCEDRLIMFVLDLHFPGTDTTSNTLLTGFLYLMTYPHIHGRCQQEINQVLEKKDHASYDDRRNMPYTQAVIHEVQRIANTVPLSVYHCTTKDTKLMGYFLPKGEFAKPDAFMPFSAGPRVGLAPMALFLIMVTLLRRFKFIWPEDAEQPD